jgi:hypothetical protein
MDLESDAPVAETVPATIRQDGVYAWYLENEGQPTIRAADNWVFPATDHATFHLEWW